MRPTLGVFDARVVVVVDLLLLGSVLVVRIGIRTAQQRDERSIVNRVADRVGRRTLIVTEGHVRTHAQPRSDARIHRRTERILAQRRVGSRTLLVHVTAGDVVCRILRTARNRDVGLVYRSVVAVVELAPVGVDARVDAVFVRSLADEAVLQLVSGQLRGVHHLVLAGRGLRNTVEGIHHHAGLLAAATLLQRDVEHAVCRTRTVDRGSRRILEHRHRLDVVRVERQHGLHRDGHAVEHYQRRGACRQRTYAVQTHRRSGRGLTRRGVNLKTGHLALEGVGDVGRGFVLKRLALHLHRGTDGGADLRTRTVAYDHDVVDGRGVAFETDVDMGAVSDGNRLGLITDVRNDERSVGRRGKREATVYAGRGSGRGAIHHDRCTDDRQAVGIYNCTGNLLVLSE